MNPAAEYSQRAASRIQAYDALQKRFLWIGNVRLATGIATALALYLVIGEALAPLWTLLIPVTAFVALAFWHPRVVRARDSAKRAAAFYQAGLARLNGTWGATGNSGEQFLVPDHPFAGDLDLFGRASLFQLLCRARTSVGQSTVAAWLLHPATRDEALARQAAVRELAPQLDLREEIALVGEEVQARLDSERLRTWASATPEHFAPWLSAVAALLAVLGVATLILLLTGMAPLGLMALVLALDAAFIYKLRHKVSRTFEGLTRASTDMEVLSLLLARLEREHFTTPRARLVEESLRTRAGLQASRRVARLSRIMGWVDSSDHIVVRAVRPLVLWKEQCAFAVDRWRRENASQVAAWLTAVGDFEALSSFASLAFERPSWTFPDLVEDRAQGVFNARRLSHPLINPALAVANDVDLGAGAQLLIISGSNMSGKSTLLRAIGLAALLAWAGAPVPADSLTISPLQIGASIRANDSLEDNRSRFFAEITRLRQILALEGHRVLFLLDELLSGTNSHDRRIGARAIVKALVDRGALGCMTTHDLALAELATDLPQRAINAHFEDQVIGGEMRFDYKLRPGIVTRSNALDLMRMIGLPV